MLKRISIAAIGLLTGSSLPAAEPSNVESSFSVELAPHPLAAALLPDSAFGINTALRPDAPDLEARLKAIEEAGIKWGRQDFTWRSIEREEGKYDFEPYERLEVECRKRGILLFGCLAYAPRFHDPRTQEGAEEYATFARKAADSPLCGQGGVLADLERAERRLLAGHARGVRPLPRAGPRSPTPTSG